VSALSALGGRKLSQVERVPYTNAFLIAELLTNKITILAGEPKAGKTLLAAGMVTALLGDDEEFLGQAVHRQLNHVAFGLTDDDAEAELLERFVGTGVEDKVTVFPISAIDSQAEWEQLRHALIDDGVDLFVLDNMLGALGYGADISDSPTTASFMREVKQISQHIPVLLVTHVAKGVLEGTSIASAPIGGRYIASSARGIMALRHSQKQGRRLDAVMNRGRSGELRLHVDVTMRWPGTEVPVWAVREGVVKADSKQERGTQRLNEARRVAQMVIDDQPDTPHMSQIYRLYKDRTDLGEDAIRKWLVKPLLDRRESKWVWSELTKADT
jgi:hypothetical protein